jgi:hypothetical protein
VPGSVALVRSSRIGGSRVYQRQDSVPIPEEAAPAGRTKKGISMSQLNAVTPVQDRKQARRSRRFRRGLVALGIAVTVPGAFATASASARTADIYWGTKSCGYGEFEFNHGTLRTTGGNEYMCIDGNWYRTSA